MTATTQLAQPEVPTHDTAHGGHVQGCPEHYRSYHRGCPGCKKFNRYNCARRRRSIKLGLHEPDVPTTLVQQHLKRLLDPHTGGWTVPSISERTGIPTQVLYSIKTARYPKVRGFIWKSLQALQPTGRPAAFHRSCVPALESARIAQALAAQGFPMDHQARLVGIGAKAVRRLAARPDTTVLTSTRDAFRALAKKLGPYDIAVMVDPLPGMTRDAADRAAARGWLPLSAWAGQDLADPHAQPRRTPTTVAVHLVPDDDDEPLSEPSSHEIPFIDKVVTSTVRANVERIRDTDTNRGRRPMTYLAPLGRLTRLEMYAVVDLADRLGVADSGIAQMLGYPCRTAADIESGMRSVQRFMGTVKKCRDWFAAASPEAGPPGWYTSGQRRAEDLIPPMLALQGDPHGPGWTLGQLARISGLTDDELAAFLPCAIQYANRLWQPPTCQDRKAAA